MKKLFLFCFAFVTLTASAVVTPFTFQFNLSGGAANTNVALMQYWPPQDNTITIVGTNIVFGGSNIVLTPDVNGFGSNQAYGGFYRVFFTNLQFGFFVNIPDTTNTLPLSAYVSGTPSVYVAGSLYNVFTNAFGGALVLSNNASVNGALGFTAANAANLGTIAGRGSNDYALSTPAGVTNSLGYIPAHAELTNDFARATVSGITNALGFIPGNAAMTNLYALTSSLGTMSLRSTNDFAMTNYNGLEQTVAARTDVKVITNGATVAIFYKTNNLPGSAFTNYPNGSTIFTTNGYFGVLSNITWHAIAIP